MMRRAAFFLTLVGCASAAEEEHAKVSNDELGAAKDVRIYVNTPYVCLNDFFSVHTAINGRRSCWYVHGAELEVNVSADAPADWCATKGCLPNDAAVALVMVGMGKRMSFRGYRDANLQGDVIAEFDNERREWRADDNLRLLDSHSLSSFEVKVER